MAKPKNAIGRLFLIPSILGDNEPLEVLPISIKGAIESIDHYVVENEKSARRFIKKISPRKSQSKLKIETLNKFTKTAAIPTFLQPCMDGYDVGIISDAGCPGIADPGSDVVIIAHEKNIKVVPMVGPSSILLAMMASGFNGQNFAFIGYLPIENADRKRAIKELEKRSKEANQSQIFIETPYRNEKLLQELLKTLKGNTLLCVACDITLPTEQIATKSISEWKHINWGLHKRPAIFIVHVQ
jgi:16S rRNA (cytidine1402-2'-O)-methyltransferase